MQLFYFYLLPERSREKKEARDVEEETALTLVPGGTTFGDVLAIAIPDAAVMVVVDAVAVEVVGINYVYGDNFYNLEVF